ncbi:MAG TPA: maleate cis-trans isomerase [Clostridiales bacterium]|jgi:maleate isomerase|nr:maleate cis-trans isomerase [Clostridiales bacterium]
MLDTTGLPYVDGQRGRIGLITPAPGSSTEWEFNHYKPEGVAVLTTRVPLFGISYEGISKMNSYVDQAAEMLAKSSIVDLILFSCTAGSFLEGRGHDQKMIRHLEEFTGVKVTTTSTCVMEAVHTLGIRSLHVVTPYSHEINKLEKRFLEDSGLKVLSITGALLEQSQNTPKIPAETMRQYALAADTPDADAIFISCTGLHVDTIIEPLEKELGKPVLTSNQCGLWGSLRAIGVTDKISGLGRLFNY